MFLKSELALLVSASFLIAIWPMRDTIAARNILLVVCTLISIFYLYKNWRLLVWNQKQSIKNWMPFILVTLLFVWVVVHYFLFSYDPASQLKELTSTWARSLMAAVIGFTVGIIVNKRNNGYGLMMLALIGGLLILFYQYIALATQTGNLFQPMHWTSIYWGKINEVLLGTLFIAGALGFYERAIFYQYKSQSVMAKIKSCLPLVLYLLGVVLILYCYVFAVDTRNGIGIAAILILGFSLKALVKPLLRRSTRVSVAKWLALLALSITLIGSLIFFVQLHIKKNTGWNHYWEDMQIASQVDQYSNWQTIPSTAIYAPSGRQIPANTYERTAWIVVATKTIAKYPLGYGLIHRAFRHLVKLNYPNSDLTISHSGWLDFGLSFGVPGLALLLGSLLWTLGLSVGSKSASTAPMTPIVFWTAIGLLLAYALLEIMYYHGLEILLFWLTFLPALLLPVHSNGPVANLSASREQIGS